MQRRLLAVIAAVLALGTAAAVAPSLVSAAGGSTPPAPGVPVERSFDKQAGTGAVVQRPDATATGPAGEFVPITPYRTYDSRNEDTGWFAGQYGVYDATTDAMNVPQIPTTATAVTFNATVVTYGTGGGFVQILTPGGTLGGTSTVNYTGPNQFVANGGTVGLVNKGLEIYVGGSTTQEVDVIIDITGYYQPAS